MNRSLPYVVVYRGDGSEVDRIIIPPHELTSTVDRDQAGRLIVDTYLEAHGDAVDSLPVPALAQGEWLSHNHIAWMCDVMPQTVDHWQLRRRPDTATFPPPDFRIARHYPFWVADPDGARSLHQALQNHQVRGEVQQALTWLFGGVGFTLVTEPRPHLPGVIEWAQDTGKYVRDPRGITDEELREWVKAKTASRR